MMLESFDEQSKYVAVFEDDGTSAWLYLSHANDRKPIADVWVYNRVEAPPTSEIKNYRGGPPPAAIGFADDATICRSLGNFDWTFAWYEDGRVVVLYRDGRAVAMLDASDGSGWSRYLLRDGPWGRVWDEDRYSVVAKEAE